MPEKNDVLNKPGEREIVITRVLSAPRELVFEAWTDPKHLAKWWGPDGWTITIHQIDVRPGGAWKFTMHGPNDMNFPNQIIYDEIEKPIRLAYTQGSGQKDDPMQFQAVITFEKDGDKKTKVTMRSIFPSAAVRDEVIEKYHALEGAKQHLANLEAYVEKMN
jgi:uncharacterized protein YndB with AHSA1/START domain